MRIQHFRVNIRAKCDLRVNLYDSNQEMVYLRTIKYFGTNAEELYQIAYNLEDTSTNIVKYSSLSESPSFTYLLATDNDVQNNLLSS